MAQSLTAIYIHAVFGTKYRTHIIDEKIESALHAYMAGILKNLGCPTLKINSMPDHVHILFRLSKNLSIAKVMEVVKKDSSKWMKTQGYQSFKWQRGYGAFSVSQSKVEVTSRYIERQKEHHSRKSFEKEVEGLMENYKVDNYSEVYFWD